MDWKHEKEHRLVLSAGLDETRSLKYQFKNLSGVCFGIKTPAADKVRVMRIIEQKCQVEGRTDFEFYQARYSARTRRMEMVLLRLLKITTDVDAPADSASS
jgi:hypothetical protein